MPKGGPAAHAIGRSRGGLTSKTHAIIGTGYDTHVLHDEQVITVSCAEGEEGCVYDGRASFHLEEIDAGQLPETKTTVMFNMANASAGSRWWRLPADGVGLARMDFVDNTGIKVRPLALTAAYPDKPAHFVDQLATGLSRIAAVH